MILDVIIVLTFILMVGGIIFWVLSSSKRNILEISKDKIVFISEELSRTNGYQIGFVEDIKEIGNRYILHLRPSHKSIDEKITDIKPFTIVVLKSMVLQHKHNKFTTMRILPYFETKYITEVKNSPYYKDMVDLTAEVNMLQIANNRLEDALNGTITKHGDYYNKLISNILGKKQVVNKKVNTFEVNTNPNTNNQSNNYDRR